MLVCVGPSPTTAKLIRTAKRMADAFGAEWLAVAVETQGQNSLRSAARSKVIGHLRLADQLGAETHTLVGDNIAQTVLDYARSRNVTKIVVGKTAQPWWQRWLLGTVVDRLLEQSGDIDIYVIRGESDGQAVPPLPGPRVPLNRTHYLGTALIVIVCGLAGSLIRLVLGQALQLAEANIIMIFLLGVVFVAARYGRGLAIAASIASVLAFDFFFVPPFFSFSVSDTQYILTFAVMLGIGLLISELTAPQGAIACFAGARTPHRGTLPLHQAIE